MTIYEYWDSSQAVDKYRTPRKWDQRFRSEKHFLEKIGFQGMSVLDVGCATGDLCLGLEEYLGNISYTGLDVAENLLEIGRALCPNACFVKSSFLDERSLEPESFDLVTATGVLQHEPASEEMIRKMLKVSRRYVLFDLKLSHSHETLCDINRSYCDHDPPIYFIVFNIHDILRMLNGIDGITRLEFFGYYSGTNKSVRLPESVREPVCSAHVLLERGKGNEEANRELVLNLPKDIVNSLV